MAFLVVVLLHVLAVVVDVYAIYYNEAKVKVPSQYEFDFGGKLKFLTVWNMILQAVYFSICLVNDAVGDHDPNPQSPPLIRRIKDYIFASFAFPIAMFVGITFWSIMAIDRELVLPKKLDAYFPLWLNHIMHTNIVIFILLEMFLSCRKYPTRKNGLTGLTIFMAIYLTWTFVIYYNTGLWVYPVMNVMNWPLRICFLLAMLGFCLILYLGGDFINNKRWGELLHPEKDKAEIPNPDETLPITDVELNGGTV